MDQCGGVKGSHYKGWKYVELAGAGGSGAGRMTAPASTIPQPGGRCASKQPSTAPRGASSPRVSASNCTRSEWDQGIRVGNLATIEQIQEHSGLSVKVDSGASLQLTPEQAQHVEYGYAIESTKRLAVDRVILSGEAEQITAQREALSELAANLHELTVYTSDAYQAALPC